jgi:hypothetical protein
MHDDAMSLAMFWTGMLMVFAPIVSAGLVVGIWWFTRKRPERAAGSRAAPPR